MQLVVEPVWSWPWVVIAIVVVFAIVLTTYPQRLRYLSRRHRRLLLGMRLSAALLLALAMLRPALEHTETDTRSHVLLFGFDASRSGSTRDGGTGDMTRRQAMLKTIDECNRQLEALGEKIEIRMFDFAERLTPIEKLEDKTDGNQTAFGAVLDEFLRETQSKRVVGIILLSDGAQRAVSPYDADPRDQARILGQLQIPVHTVAYGGTGVTGSAVDLAVEDLLVDPLVFEKKAVPVSVKIRALGAAGREFTVRLLVEDRTGKPNGQPGEMKVPPATRNVIPAKRVPVRRNEEVIPVELSYVPDRPGEFKIAVEVVPLDGELKIRNNVLSTIITVQKGGIKVAYFDKLRPEIRSLHMAKGEEKFQLDSQIVRAGEFANLTEIDPEMFAPGKYDVYIIGDVPASTFGNDLLRQLRARVNEGAGLLMTGGFKSFGPGGYSGTPLADVLPVRMDRSEFQPDDDIRSDLHHLGELQMIPTTQGLQHYVMRLDTAGNNRKRWEKLSPLKGANKLRRKNQFVQVLAVSQKERIPLLLAHEVGAARVMAFAGDTTYLWFQHGFREEHQRFWRQMILYLAHKELESDQPVWVRVDPRNYLQSQRVQLEFGARAADGSPLADADFTVEVLKPSGGKQQLSPRRSGESNTADFLDTAKPGDYWVRVDAERGGKSHGFSAWTRFVVDSRDLELDNPAADHALLQEISALTGGSSMPPEQLVSFLDRMLAGDGLTGEVTRTTHTRLWDNWSFLLAFVCLMTVEWYVRKRRGLV